MRNNGIGYLRNGAFVSAGVRVAQAPELGNGAPMVATSSPSLGLRRFFVALAGTCCLLAGLAPAFAANGEAPRHILILSSYHREYRWGEDIIRGVDKALKNYPHPVEYSHEYLDTKRYPPDPAYFALIADVLGYKYRQRKPDLLILSDNNAFDFVARYYDQLFSGVPVVFTGINDYVPAMRERIPNSTGLSQVKDMAGTVDLALRLHPGTRTMAIVSDSTTTSRLDRQLVLEAARKHPELTVMDLMGEDLTLREILENLRGLSDAMVFYVSFWSDRSGATFRVDEVLPLITSAAPVPVYTHSDAYLCWGVVGGIVTYAEYQGLLAGEMAARILDGEPPASIPVATKSNVSVFDYQQLRRWDLDMSALPSDALIVNRPPPTFYARYTRLIWSVIATFAILVSLIVGLVLSIAFRRRAERALRESEARYRRLVEAAPLPILVHRESRFLYLNPMALRMYGTDNPDDLVGKRLEDFIHPDDRSRFQHRIERFRTNTEPNNPHTALRIVRVDGQVADIEATSILADYEGKDAFLAVCQDVTERKRAERERRRLETQVQQAQKLESLGVLAGGIAHDFNNLLMGVLGNADLMRMDLPENSACHEQLGHIENSARRAAELCQQMLAYSGRGRFEIVHFNVSDIVSEMVHILRVSISKKAELQFDFQEDLPLVEGDPTQMRQVVMNLITNASEALGESEGSITVRTRAREYGAGELEDGYLHETRPAGRYVMLEVIDTGCGMDDETRSRLFDPFFSTKFTGRGLGLAAVLGIVRGHLGVVQVESRSDVGSTMRVLLPAVESPTPAVEQQSEERVERPQSWFGSGTILLVDDEDTVVNVARDMLERLGFDVLVARDGKQAISVFRRHADDVQCVLLDLTMPRMDGEECFQELRRIRADVPVILSSGYNEGAVTQRFVGKGLADFVQKPYRTDVLRESLQRLLGNSNETV